MKRLLLIICLLPVLAYGQFSGAKKLLLQQGEYCEYGNLANYTNKLDLWNNVTSAYPECAVTGVAYVSLAEVRQTLDNMRSCHMSVLIGSRYAFCVSFSVGNTVLDYFSQSGQQYPKCEIFPIADYWAILVIPELSRLPIGQVPIVHIENGVITYIEYY